MLNISQDYLENINNSNVLQYFGKWTENVDILKENFINAKPFEHVVIDNFLNDEYIEKMHQEFPSDYTNWHKYCNPLEYKYSNNNIDLLQPIIKNVYYYLSSNEMLSIFKKFTNIDNLEYDEYMHGAGLHVYPSKGKLNVHLDYEKHPFSGKERRLNIILFMNKNWNDEWNGANELWDEELKNCIVETKVKFNRAIIFKTNDKSYHGVPKEIACPLHKYRKTLAYYYVSPLTNVKKHEYRSKAVFKKLYYDEYNSNMEKLYKIRKERLITNDDLNSFI